MKIIKVTYIENGYFTIFYDKLNTVTIQDIGAIKMTVPTSPIIKDILQFLRKLKLEKLNDNNFDELKYRGTIIYGNEKESYYYFEINRKTNQANVYDT